MTLSFEFFKTFQAENKVPTHILTAQFVVRKAGNPSLTSGMSLEDVLPFCSVVRNGVAALRQLLILKQIL